jgi:hypothetical protein
MVCRWPAIPERSVRNRDQLLVVERHHAEALEAEAVVPGVEVHIDPDVTCIVHPGSTWRNAAIMARFSSAAAKRPIELFLGSEAIVLLASSEGQRFYERRGFIVAGHMGYWYRSFQRG